MMPLSSFSQAFCRGVEACFTGVSKRRAGSFIDNKRFILSKHPEVQLLDFFEGVPKTILSWGLRNLVSNLISQMYR